MQIVIQTLGGQRLELDIEKSTTVAATKSLIREKLGIAPTLQSLVLEGIELQDENVLVDCGVDECIVLNLLVADENWLEILQHKAKELSNGYELGCNDLDVELVEDMVHERLLAGELDEWKSKDTQTGRGWLDEYSRTPFEPVSAEVLLARQKWLADVLGDKVSEVGQVWPAGYRRSTGSKDWIHDWFVFEFRGRTFRVHEYCFMKG
eukprot:TRINITY_DN44778_c0_g1_i1.p1 TRINITY_DN44778_c0_g1~~TRINITY_DN44778_c0_g1_i1.p1  ORF type:complete len:207 (-),score=36.34 TRINITY_DN44778_c0_g1_i1:79-699(-)